MQFWPYFLENSLIAQTVGMLTAWSAEKAPRFGEFMRMLNRQYFRDESSVSNRLKFDQAKISKAEKTQFVQLRWKWNTKSKSKHSGHINWSLRLMPTFENNRMSHAHRIYIMRSGGTSVEYIAHVERFTLFQNKEFHFAMKESIS